LRTLGRKHGPEEARSLARLSSGLEGASVGLDLIYGVPGQGLESWMETLDEALGCRPQHVSAYALTLDASTPMGAAAEAGGIVLPEEGSVVEMYEAACRILGRAGYRHYEISNFCLAGRECAHNLACWRREGYLGLGASAHSFDPPASRRHNLADLGAYVAEAAAGRLPVEEQESLTPEEAWEEEVLLSLRTAEGASEELLTVGGGPPESWDTLVESGLAWRDKGRCGLTERGMFVSDHIIAGLLAG
jgi:oxygen-independent coproporphyrinogen-3 oxidase